MKIEQRSAALGPASISYRVAGDGPPVVLIHGLAASSRWWTRNITDLARSHRVYALDLIGFGASRGNLPFNLEDAASHLATWMDSLGIERASIIGHSMGGFIGASLTADFPEHVERLMLVGAAALPLNRRYLWETLGPVRGLLDLSFDSFSLLVSDALRAGPLTIWNAARELSSADITAKLSTIQAPVLLIWGEHDAIIPLRTGRRIAEILPQAELVVIKNAGHNVMFDHPDAFNQAAMDFLGGTPGNGTVR
jgi:pimeloyl-ACP methyl ester carboxylesterase